MNLGDFLKIENFETRGYWKLNVAVNGYENSFDNSLVTQVAKGRNFQIIQLPKMNIDLKLNSQRMKVRLLEDGYLCWLTVSEVLGNAYCISTWKPNFLNSRQISECIPKVLEWVRESSQVPNKYLWGGAIGPDFDCSGLVQAAFSSEGIWLPRDAYQQEQFCLKVEYSLGSDELLLPGDLVFFGTKARCNHVGIHINRGNYWHSSGILNGLDGIAMSSLYENDSVSSYYRSIFRSIGRVYRCHDGTTLP
ncbi:C40 family peptidase [Prochlorococcus sp. MIT 1223]|uniref:C40 family peptidase n=1 Tax=Prochlorococcus sp. MIT 1223 TaxID=3096217 RepID=UPI002A752AC4|nr:C40 family peptidase [Prochlorococcus sp. MIT 1223]